MQVHRRLPAGNRRVGHAEPARLRPHASARRRVARDFAGVVGAGPRLAPATDAGREAPDGRARILVVEDEALVAMATSQLLEDAGYEVVGMAADAAQAMRLADRERPDLVLMDIRLRGGDDGVETAAQIRQRYGLRILYVSAHGDSATLARAAKTDPAGFVGKPHTTDELLNAVDRALGAN
jgi:CheY-like chemotaxis protein